MLLGEVAHSTGMVANIPRSGRKSFQERIGTTDTLPASRIWSQGRGRKDVDKRANLIENWHPYLMTLTVQARLEVLPLRLVAILAVLVLVLTTLTTMKSDRRGGSWVAHSLRILCWI